jgi:hypothetical protein
MLTLPAAWRRDQMGWGCELRGAAAAVGDACVRSVTTSGHGSCEPRAEGLATCETDRRNWVALGV